MPYFYYSTLWYMAWNSRVKFVPKYLFCFADNSSFNFCRKCFTIFLIKVQKFKKIKLLNSSQLCNRGSKERFLRHDRRRRTNSWISVHSFKSSLKITFFTNFKRPRNEYLCILCYEFQVTLFYLDCDHKDILTKSSNTYKLSLFISFVHHRLS